MRQTILFIDFENEGRFIHGLNLKIKLLFLSVLCIYLPRLGFAQITSSTTGASAASITFFIEPSSTSLAGGRASLIVRPLTRQGDNYVGDYQLKVMPYFFKNEKGKLLIGLSEESLRKIMQGNSVSFSGTAMTSGSIKTRPINGIVTPAGNNRGSVTFAIKTTNGALIFTAPYKSADK